MCLIIEIKTKIEKVLEVKPFMGFIRPGQNQKIVFKAFKKIVIYLIF